MVDYANIRNNLIEAGYREQAAVPDSDAIIEHCRDAASAIMVTKRADAFGEHTVPDGSKLLRIITFAFLYLLGHAEKDGYKGV